MAAIFSQALSWLCDPIILFVLLLLASLLCRTRTTLLVWCLTCFGYLLVVGFSPLPEYLLRNLESKYVPNFLELPYKEYAVVLGGDNIRFATNRNQYQYNESFDRVGEALRLFKSHKVNKIIVTGGDAFANSRLVNEAQSSFDWLVAMGVPPENIILEPNAKSTRENAFYVKSILESLSVKDFYLITSAWHMPRSMSVFEKLGFYPTPYPVDFKVYGTVRNWRAEASKLGSQNLSLLKVAMHEYLGLVYYFVLGYI